MQTLFNLPSLSIPVEKKQWFAVRTQLKCEKQVSVFLSRAGIECYLPLQRYTRQWGRRKVEVELPLISNYIFVNIDRSEYRKVLETEFVYGFLSFGGHLSAIPECELLLLKRILGEYKDIDVKSLEFEEGEEIEIVAGKLTGLRAKLVQQKGKNKVLALFSF